MEREIDRFLDNCLLLAVKEFKDIQEIRDELVSIENTLNTKIFRCINWFKVGCVSNSVSKEKLTNWYKKAYCIFCAMFDDFEYVTPTYGDYIKNKSNDFILLWEDEQTPEIEEPFVKPKSVFDTEHLPETDRLFLEELFKLYSKIDSWLDHICQIFIGEDGNIFKYLLESTGVHLWDVDYKKFDGLSTRIVGLVIYFERKHIGNDITFKDYTIKRISELLQKSKESITDKEIRSIQAYGYKKADKVNDGIKKNTYGLSVTELKQIKPHLKVGQDQCVKLISLYSKQST